jgi:transposase-like protein
VSSKHFSLKPKLTVKAIAVRVGPLKHFLKAWLDTARQFILLDQAKQLVNPQIEDTSRLVEFAK